MVVEIKKKFIDDAIKFLDKNVSRIYIPGEESTFLREDGLLMPHGAVLNCPYNPEQYRVHNDLSEPASSWFFRAKEGTPLISPVSGVVIANPAGHKVSCDNYWGPHNTNLVEMMYMSSKGPAVMRLEHISPEVKVGQNIEVGDYLGDSNAACGEAHVHLYFKDLNGNPVKEKINSPKGRDNHLYDPVDEAIKSLAGDTLNQKRRISMPRTNKGFDKWVGELIDKLF